MRNADFSRGPHQPLRPLEGEQKKLDPDWLRTSGAAILENLQKLQELERCPSCGCNTTFHGCFCNQGEPHGLDNTERKGSK